MRWRTLPCVVPTVAHARVATVRALAVLVSAGTILSCAQSVRAAEFPTRPIDLYIGSAPAGSTDVLGRVLAKSLGEALGQAVVVHNTPGAGGAVMAMQLLKSAPDGYSLGMTISHAYSGYPIVTPGAATYGVRDFTHLASVSKGQCALVTSAQTPYRTFGDLIAAAQRGVHPVFASQSPMTRLVADYIASVAGVQFRTITVQGGGETMQTILGGHADFGFSGGPHVDHVAAGQMRVLASAEDERLATSPDVPTLHELGYDVASCALFLVSAPPRLPEDVTHVLSAALARAIRSPEMRDLIRNLQYPEYYLGPEEVTAVLEREADSIERAVARISGTVDAQDSDALSPDFMPVLAAALGIVALTLMLVARLTRRGDRSTVSDMTPDSWRFAGAAVALLAGAFILMGAFGYLVGAIALVGGFMTLARADRWTAVTVALVFPVVLWLLFDRLLQFPLP
jgi:tripartite-type tricarboxylate transporter receptor subunit TctC